MSTRFRAENNRALACELYLSVRILRLQLEYKFACSRVEPGPICREIWNGFCMVAENRSGWNRICQPRAGAELCFLARDSETHKEHCSLEYTGPSDNDVLVRKH